MTTSGDPRRDAAPAIDEDDAETIEHPEEGFPANASPEHLDAEQFRQGEVTERQKEWIDPREQVGGED